MRHAIGYALHWPERRDLPVERLDLAKIGALTFRAPDPVRYPALGLAQAVMDVGGKSGAAFNAAKETALDAFIAGQISFVDMSGLVEDVLDKMWSSDGLNQAANSIDDILETDRLARRRASDLIAISA